MKQLIALVTLVFLLQEAQAQYPKLIVAFKDKNGTTGRINNPASLLSQRAIARRTRHRIAIDSADLPVSQRYVDSVLSKGPVTVLSRSRWLNQVLIQCTDAATIARIQALPFVQTVQGIGYRQGPMPTVFQETISSTLPPLLQGRIMQDAINYGNNYSQVHIHEGEYLHNQGYTGKGILIGVLDAGFNSYKAITAFDSVRLNGQILGERDFVAFDNSVNEDDSHGMHCLSIMCANWPGRMVGTAPKASYWLVRTENAATEFPIEEHNWVVGAEFLDSTGADMISSSLGYNTFDDPSFNHTYAEFYRNMAMVSRGATTAAKKGMIVMNSAGNEGNGAWKYIGFPAEADSVCAVGAVTPTGTVASFSSYGYTGKVKPNIASVGAGTVIASFGNTPVTGNGTSYANPNIAGLIACLWQAFPEFNNMQILEAVYRSCPGYNTPNDRVGFGIPNMRIAYQLLEEKRALALQQSWLTAAPVPFNNSSNLQVTLRAPETGKAALRLIDSKGSIVEQQELQIVRGSVYQLSFRNTFALAKGVYHIVYVGEREKQSITVVKQ